MPWTGGWRTTCTGCSAHRAFRTLTARPDLRPRLAASTGLDEVTLDAIAAQARAVADWLSAQGYPRLHLELPLQQVAPDGSETNAILDILAEGDQGLMILDQKSGACLDPAARFAGYLPQLAAYADLAAAATGKPVDGIAVFWMSEGMISVAPAPAVVGA